MENQKRIYPYVIYVDNCLCRVIYYVVRVVRAPRAIGRCPGVTPVRVRLLPFGRTPGELDGQARTTRAKRFSRVVSGFRRGFWSALPRPVSRPLALHRRSLSGPTHRENVVLYYCRYGRRVPGTRVRSRGGGAPRREMRISPAGETPRVRAAGSNRFFIAHARSPDREILL